MVGMLTAVPCTSTAGWHHSRPRCSPKLPLQRAADRHGRGVCWNGTASASSEKPTRRMILATAVCRYGRSGSSHDEQPSGSDPDTGSFIWRPSPTRTHLLAVWACPSDAADRSGTPSLPPVRRLCACKPCFGCSGISYNPLSYDDAVAIRNLVADALDVEITAAGDAGRR